MPDASQPPARAPARPARPKLPFAIFLLGLTSFFTDLSAEMIFPLLPVFLTEVLRASPMFLGLLEGAADALSSILKLVSGRLSDRLARRKPLVVAGYALASAARPLLAAAMAPWHVLVVRLTDRVGKGLRSSPRDALIADAAGPEAAGRAFGFHRAMDHAGAVVGPLIATALLALGLHLRTVFWLAAIPAAFAVVAVLFVRVPRPGAAAASHASAASGAAAAPGTTDAAAPAATATPAPALAPGAAGSPVRLALPRSFALYLGILAVFSLGNSSDVFLLLRAHDLGVPTALIPILWAALHVIKMASSWLAGSWSDRVPRVWLVVAGWAVFAAAYLALGLARASWQVWIIFGVYGLHFGLTEPVERALVRDLVPEALRGRAFGWYHFVIGIAALPAGLLMGTLWNVYSPPVALAVGAGAAALAAVLLLVWSRTAAPSGGRT